MSSHAEPMLNKPRTRTKDSPLSKEGNQVGDTIVFAGNEGRITGVSPDGMITVKTSDQVQVIDPSIVFVWNQRVAYQQLVAGIDSKAPSDLYFRKDELLAYILSRSAYYNSIRYQDPEGKTQKGWVENQIYYDILAYLKPTGPVKEPAPTPKTTLP